MPNSSGKIDIEAALKRIGDDIPLYKEIASIFLEDFPNQINALKIAFSEQNIIEAKKIIHSMKSAASAIGASALCDTISNADSSLEFFGLSKAAECYEGILLEFDETKKALAILKVQLNDD